MGQNPDAIREEIDRTRNEMGETVEALGYKADVKGRARAKISSKGQALKEKITGTTHRVTDGVSGATHRVTDPVSNVPGAINDRTPSMQDVKQGARQTVGMAQENPLGLAIGAAAIGFIAGIVMPKTRIEDEKIGPVAQQAREKAMEAGQQALEHGQQVAQEVADQAKSAAQDTVQQVKETAKDSAQQHAQELKDEQGVGQGQQGSGGGTDPAAGSGSIEGPPFGESQTKAREGNRAGVT